MDINIESILSIDSEFITDMSINKDAEIINPEKYTTKQLDNFLCSSCIPESYENAIHKEIAKREMESYHENRN